MVLKVLYLSVVFYESRTEQMKEYWNTLSFFKKISFAASIVLFVLTIIFSFQNWEKVQLNLVFKTVEMHLTLIIGIAWFLGFIFSILSSRMKIMKKEVEINNLKLRIKELNKEIDELKS
jgi:uncharacterized integral membrane protein